MNVFFYPKGGCTLRFFIAILTAMCVVALSACSVEPTRTGGVDVSATKSSPPVLAKQKFYRVPAHKMLGGDIDRNAKNVNAIYARGEFAVIDLPLCLSACTFYLSKTRSCILPETTFGFHGPQSTLMALSPAGVLPITGMLPKVHQHYVNLMADGYNNTVPGLGDWFRAHAADRAGMHMVYVKGSWIHENFGVPYCSDEQLAAVR